MKRFLWAVAVGGWSCTACVGGGGNGGELGKPVALFPSQLELSEVASSASATPKGAAGVADVDNWQMQTQPAPVAQYPTETTWDQLVVSTAQAHGAAVTLSPELRCAAEEAARFYTVNSGMPDDGLREHLLLRCGSTLPGHSYMYITEQVPENVPLNELERQGRSNVQDLVDRSFREPGLEFGLGAARGNGRYAVVGFRGKRRASLHGFTPVVPGDSVSLSGELKTQADSLLALATRGQYGVALCDVDPLQRLPAFKITCPLAAADAATRIEIATKQQGRVLLEAAPTWKCGTKSKPSSTTKRPPTARTRPSPIRANFAANCSRT